MKKILALLFVLVLCFACLTVVACNPGNSTKTDATQSGIEKAMAYVHELYKSDSKDKPTVTTGDYDLITNVPISGENFSVSWKIEKVNESDLDVAKIVTAEDGTLKVAIVYNSEYNTKSTDYKLIATVTNGTDTQTRTYNRQVPEFAFTTYEEWLKNCKAGSITMNIKAYVIGVVSTSSSSGGSMYLQDAEGHGYYAYNPALDAADKASDEALRAAYPVGCEVVVSGTGVVYGGQYEFSKGCTVKKTGNSIAPDQLKTLDASDVFASVADNQSETLIPYQNTLVTLRDCTLTAISGQYYYFTIGEKQVKFNIYDNTYFITAADQKAWKENFKIGYTATITGIVSCYSKVYQIYPVSADVITETKAPDSKTFSAMLALEPFKSTVIPTSGMLFQLPLTHAATGVSIAWALDKTYDFITFENGVLTITALPADTTTVTLTATLTLEGDTTRTKEFTLTVNSANTAWTSVADAITACEALDSTKNETSKGWYYIKGVVSDTPTADYANFNFVDGEKSLKIYGLYDVYGDKRYGTKRQIAEIPFGMGDTVALYCQLQNYNGTLEIVNARLLSVEKATVTPELKVGITKSELTLPGNVTETGSIDLVTVGATYGDVAISWALDKEYDFAKIENGKLVISTIPATATKLTVTATLTCEGNTDTVTFTVTVRRQYEMPAVDTPFVLALDQTKLGKTLYFAGDMSGFYYKTTENILEAVEVKIEAVEGGYRIYFMKDDAKQYLDIIPREGATGKVNVTISATPSAVYTFDSELGVFTATVEGKTWYLGTFNTNTTLSASETYRISGDNASTVGVSQFVCYFATKEITDTVKVNAEKNISIDDITEAGSIDLPTTGKTYTDVTITGWALDKEYTFAKIEDGKLVISDLPETETIITLTATVACNGESVTATVTVTVKGKTIEWITPETAAELCNALDNGATSTVWYYIRGIALDTPNSTYANFNLGDANGNKLYVYGLSNKDGSVVYGSNKSGTLAPFEEGATVELYCQLMKYVKNSNVTLEIVNAQLYSFTPAEKTEDEKIDYEIGKITIDSTISAAGEKALVVKGGKYTDVTIEWTYEGTDGLAVISEDGTKVTYTLPTEADVVITLTATVKCGATTKTKAFNITLKKEGTETPAASYYEKVTAAPADWSGTYLIVYEASDTQAYIFNGTDASGNSVPSEFVNGKIESTDDVDVCQIIVEKCGEGYSMKLKGGTNAGKYLTAVSGKNKIAFSDTAKGLTLTCENGVVVIKDGNAPFQYNNGNTNGQWFRFFGKKNGGQQAVSLYKLPVADNG